MKVDWQVIPHHEQRYETSGDWRWDGELLIIRISRMSDWRFEFCCGLHEVIEAVVCRSQGITHEMVDAFDMSYEAAHQRGDATYPCGCPHRELSDPGSDKHSPYYWPHRVADAAERVVALALRVPWAEYDQEVEKPSP